jgi:hypothetical protein
MEPAPSSPGPERPASAEPMEENAPLSPAVPVRCATDPSVETYLRCGRCEKPICPRCLIQTPVGSRCRDCAQLRKLPMFVVSPLDYLKGVAGGLVASIGGGFGLTLMLSTIPRLGFLSIFLMAGLGYIVGEGMALATRRKRSRGLAIIAVLLVPIGLIVARAGLFTLGGADPLLAVVGAAVLLVDSIWSLLGLGFAMFIAYTRVR